MRPPFFCVRSLRRPTRKGIHKPNHLCDTGNQRPSEAKRGNMSVHRRQSGLGGVIYFLGVIAAGLYFTFASVQGDYGLFNRVRIDAEAAALEAERDALTEEIAGLRNKTHRLSDDYLDLDLLDEQARSVLGMVRGDEVVLR